MSLIGEKAACNYFSPVFKHSDPCRNLFICLFCFLTAGFGNPEQPAMASSTCS